jgi:hypothetical protein
MWSQAMFLVVSTHDDMDMKLTEKKQTRALSLFLFLFPNGADFVSVYKVPFMTCGVTWDSS